MKKTFLKYKFVSMVLFLSLTISGFADITHEAYKHLLNQAINKNILVKHQQFFDNTVKLQQDIQGVCKQNTKLNKAKVSFKNAIMNFAYIEWLDFGPSAMNDTKMKIAFFPDKHGVGSRQLRRAISQKKTKLLDQIKSGKGSFALQGLGTLDQLLYKYNIHKNSYACQLALAVSINLKNLSQQLLKQWSEEGKKILLYSKLIEDANEYSLKVLNALQIFIQKIRDYKLGAALNRGKKIKAHKLEYKTSELSLLVLTENLKLMQFFIKQGLPHILNEQEQKRLITPIRKALTNISKQNLSLKKALQKDKNFVQDLYDQVNVLLLLYEKMMLAKFKVSKAFNALDGD